MKLILQILIIGVLTYFLSYFLPWWTGMAASFLVCYIKPSGMLRAFITGFLSVGLVWLGQAWQLDAVNGSVFSSKIIELFPVDESIYLILLTGLVGGISAGFAGMSGASLRTISKKGKSKGYYS